MAKHSTLGGRALDPQKQAAFWALALDYVPEPGYDGPDVALLVGVGPAIGWLRVADGLHTSNHHHIDIRVAGEGPWDMVERGRLTGSWCRCWSTRAPRWCASTSRTTAGRPRGDAGSRGQRVLRGLMATPAASRPG